MIDTYPFPLYHRVKTVFARKQTINRSVILKLVLRLAALEDISEEELQAAVNEVLEENFKEISGIKEQQRRPPQN